MLVFARKPNEAIKIGQDIEIVVLEIHGNRVKLGLVAPAEVPIHRREVHEKINCRPPGTRGVRVIPVPRNSARGRRSRSPPAAEPLDVPPGTVIQPLLAAIRLQPEGLAANSAGVVPMGMSSTRLRSISGNSAR